MGVGESNRIERIYEVRMSWHPAAAHQRRVSSLQFQRFSPFAIVDLASLFYQKTRLDRAKRRSLRAHFPTSPESLGPGERALSRLMIASDVTVSNSLRSNGEDSSQL